MLSISQCLLTLFTLLVFRAVTPKASVERQCEERESRENEAQNQCESFKSKPYKRESRENSQVGVYSILKAGYIFFFSSSPPARKAVSLYGASVARSLCEGYGAAVARSVCVCHF